MHVPKSLRAPAGAVLALLPMVLLAACGGGSDETGGTTSVPLPPSASVAASASAVPSATPSASAPSAPGASPLPTAKSVKLAGSALAATVTAAARRDKTVKSSVDVSGPLSVEGKGAGQQGGPKLEFGGTLTGGKKISVVRLGDTAYLKLPGASSWYEVDVDGEAGMDGTYRTTFSGYEVPENLTAVAKVLKKMGTFTVAGPATVSGLATTKYTVRTSATKASALLPPAYQPVNPTRMKQGRATVTAWVDAQGRLVRVTSVASIPSTKQISLKITYSGWGGAVDVAAPPAGQVTRL
ncbi:hypothetical protein ACIB24_13565 [Spongisporangium articulatum]|uniref:Lipoprotein n=1 Tax=Spongisporangium articulatum TaxID=3362603 RepID=A0ABW8ANZ0_9ACTN